MKRDFNHHSLFLRLPARYSGTGPVQESPVSVVVVAGDRLRDIGSIRLRELGPHVAQATQVVLLLAATDVTLFRKPVPPMSSSKLRAALPSLAEEHVIGDTADCAIVAGPDKDGQRLIGVCDRVWLESWIRTLQDFGVRRIRAIPVVLCLPFNPDAFSATLFSDAQHHELAIRLSDHEGVGLPVNVSADAQLPAEVTQQLSDLTGQHAVQLAVPSSRFAAFKQWMDSGQAGDITLVEQQWQDWVSVSQQVSLDLAEAVISQQPTRFDAKAWRWAAMLAGLFLVINIVALNADWWRLRSEGQQISDEITQIFRQTFPSEAVVLDPLAQMHQKLAASQRAAGQLVASDFIVLAAALGDAWREAGIDQRAIASLRYREGKLDVILKQDVPVSLEALRAPLANRRLQILPSSSEPTVWQLRSL